MKLVFLDTETTGIDEEAEIIQICLKHNGEEPMVLLFKPERPIEISAMAVHHITEKHVASQPNIKYSITGISEMLDGRVLVAHNAKFDIGRLQYHGIPVGSFVIDTLRVARHLLKEADEYNLQYLRYFLGIEIEAVSHDAKGDVMVLEAVFWRLFEICGDTFMEVVAHSDKEKEIITEMVNLSRRPVLLQKMPFGKHKGVEFKDIPKDYIQWALKNLKDMDEDLLHTMTHYSKK